MKIPLPTAAASLAVFSPEMAIPIGAQLAAFLLAFAAGAAFALLYDLFAALRRRLSSRGATLVLDGAYCLCAAAALFLFVLRLGDGRPRLYLLAAIALGAAAYWALPAAFFRPVWNFWLECILLSLVFLDAPRKFFLTAAGKVWKICKKLFYFSTKYAIMLFCKPWNTKEIRQWRRKKPPQRKKV